MTRFGYCGVKTVPTAKPCSCTSAVLEATPDARRLLQPRNGYDAHARRSGSRGALRPRGRRRRRAGQLPPGLLAPALRGPRLQAGDVPERRAVLRRGALAAHARRADRRAATRSSTPSAPPSGAERMHHANHFYGHAHIMARYVGLEQPPRIWGYLQHGWNMHDGFAVGTAFTPQYPKFVWSEALRRRGWAAGLRNYMVVGCPLALPARARAAAGVAGHGRAAHRARSSTPSTAGRGSRSSAATRLRRGGEGGRGRRAHHGLPPLERVRQPRRCVASTRAPACASSPTGSAATCGRTPTSPSSTASCTRCASTSASSATG